MNKNDTSRNAESGDPRKRINVAVSPGQLAALDLIIEREQISLTEAVHRLMGIGDYVYRALRVEGCDLWIRYDDGTEQEVVLL